MLDNGQWTMDKNALAIALALSALALALTVGFGGTEGLRRETYPDIGSILARYWTDISTCRDYN